jgi:3'(2'), 5'-bisphosphate nucleotidase
MGSRSHNNPDNQKLINAFIEMYKNVQLITAGSSLKFCKLAEGSADFYPRLSPTMEWDTAAGHAICRFADVSVINYTSGEELNYNKMNLLNPDFIAIRNKYNSFLNSALFKVEE